MIDFNELGEVENRIFSNVVQCDSLTEFKHFFPSDWEYLFESHSPEFNYKFLKRLKPFCFDSFFENIYIIINLIDSSVYAGHTYEFTERILNKMGISAKAFSEGKLPKASNYLSSNNLVFNFPLGFKNKATIEYFERVVIELAEINGYSLSNEEIRKWYLSPDSVGKSEKSYRDYCISHLSCFDLSDCMKKNVGGDNAVGGNLYRKTQARSQLHLLYPESTEAKEQITIINHQKNLFGESAKGNEWR